MITSEYYCQVSAFSGSNDGSSFSELHSEDWNNREAAEADSVKKGERDDASRKAQKGQINALMKLLSALRRQTIDMNAKETVYINLMGKEK